MRLSFQEIRPGDVEQELTQRDQFDTDKVPLTATLMREALQNVMDARAPGYVGPLRVRIGTHEAPESDEPFWTGLFSGLAERLTASEVPVAGLNFSRPNFLTIEDFGTTGLRGATTSRDNSEFSDFWRRVGRSHKSGSKGGSWGLGKLVFPVSSQLRSFFGLTIRSDDTSATPHLMGQSILNTHELNGRRYVPHGFFCENGDGGIQVPATDPDLIRRFSASTGLTRTGQAGLSIVIPFPRSELTKDALIPLIIEHYFFPILTGELVVDVGDEIISADTMDRLAARFSQTSLGDGHLIAFIRELDEARKAATPVAVPSGWDGTGGLEAVFDSVRVQELREQYLRGDLLHFRLPLRFVRTSGESMNGDFDVFLKPAPAGVSAPSLFIRNAITVPNEASYFPNQHVFAAMVASQPPASAFLRDAENPAHTSWNGRAEKLVSRWRSSGPTLSKIRNSARKLDQLVGNSENLVDENALISLLSVPRAAAERRRVSNPLNNPPPPLPEPTPRAYRITPQSGGFRVQGNGAADADNFPMTLSVRAAYALSRGDPFKRYQPFDFSFLAPRKIQVREEDANVERLGDNVLLIQADSRDFSVEVTGFDTNRDVIVQVSRVQS